MDHGTELHRPLRRWGNVWRWLLIGDTSIQKSDCQGGKDYVEKTLHIKLKPEVV